MDGVLDDVVLNQGFGTKCLRVAIIHAKVGVLSYPPRFSFFTGMAGTFDHCMICFSFQAGDCVEQTALE